MLLDARSLAEALNAPQTPAQGRAKTDGGTTRFHPHAVHSCRLAHRCFGVEPLASARPRPWWAAAPRPVTAVKPKRHRRPARTASPVVTAVVEPGSAVVADVKNFAHAEPEPEAEAGVSSSTNAPATVLDVLSVFEADEVAELVLDVRAAVRAARLTGITARLTAAARVLEDFDASVPAWLDALQDVLEVASEAGMPEWGSPRELARLAVTVLARDAGIEEAIVRRRPRSTVSNWRHGVGGDLEARLAQARREADARIVRAGDRKPSKAPYRMAEQDRRSKLSGWSLREAGRAA